MPEKKHDTFVKDVLAQILAPFGEVRPEQLIPAEPQRADVLFLFRQTPATLEAYGVLPAMASSSALFEAYRNPVTDDNIVACMSKQCRVQQELVRDHRRKVSFDMGFERKLWVITPSCTRERLEGFGFQPTPHPPEVSWPSGFYFLAPRWHYGLVVVDKLPETPATLWMRLLGRGNIQARAILEVLGLPEQHPLRRNLLQILVDWRTLFEQQVPTTDADKELFMNLHITVEEFERRATEKGLQKGLQTGLERGQLIGKILALREVLERTVSTDDDLRNMSQEDLEATLHALRARLRA